MLLATELVKIVDALDCAAFYWSATASVRHMRIRLHLRLQPGRGFATTWEVWLRWARPATRASLAASAAPGGTPEVFGTHAEVGVAGPAGQ